MKLNKRKMISAILATLLLFGSISSNGYAANDILKDPITRYDHVPTNTWSWSANGSVYTGNFQIHSYTYSNYCFNVNSSNQIYYSISGHSVRSVNAGVETHCTCGTLLSTYSFTTPSNEDDFSYHRVITVNASHASHGLYFKITNSSGYLYMTGTFKASNSYV